MQTQCEELLLTSKSKSHASQPSRSLWIILHTIVLFLAFTSFLIIAKYLKNRCWYARFPILRVRVLETFKILLLVKKCKLVTQNRRGPHQRNVYASVRIYAICVYLFEELCTRVNVFVTQNIDENNCQTCNVYICRSIPWMVHVVLSLGVVIRSRVIGEMCRAFQPTRVNTDIDVNAILILSRWLALINAPTFSSYGF